MAYCLLCRGVQLHRLRGYDDLAMKCAEEMLKRCLCRTRPGDAVRNDPVGSRPHWESTSLTPTIMLTAAFGRLYLPILLAIYPSIPFDGLHARHVPKQQGHKWSKADTASNRFDRDISDKSTGQARLKHVLPDFKSTRDEK